jgi:superoxide dismutase, Fe-Mn family
MAPHNVSRRDFLSTAAVTGAGLALTGLASRTLADEPVRMALALPPLPYPENALEPYLSAKTLQFHHGQHHKGYVDTVNFMLQQNPKPGYTLEQIINEFDGKKDKYGLYLNAVLAWNHGCLWQSMKPGGGGQPPEVLLKEIEKSYGTYQKFRDEFISVAAQGVYGWAWLVKDKGALKIIRTNYGEYPPLKQLRPLACLDLWEHAFYLDYQNRFKDYITAFIDHLINWSFVALNFTNKYQE